MRCKFEENFWGMDIACRVGLYLRIAAAKKGLAPTMVLELISVHQLSCGVGVSKDDIELVFLGENPNVNHLYLVALALDLDLSRVFRESVVCAPASLLEAIDALRQELYGDKPINGGSEN